MSCEEEWTSVSPDRYQRASSIAGVPIEDIRREGETWYAYTYPGRGSIAVLVDHPDRPQVEMEIGAVHLIFGWALKVEELLVDWRSGKLDGEFATS